MALSMTIVLSVAKNFLAALESLELKDISYFLCYKNELNALRNSVETIRDILFNAEGHENEPYNESQLNWIQLLKDATYDADDLLDELLTMAELKQSKSKEDWKASHKVCLLFSRLNLVNAYKISREIKNIRKKLDVIAKHCNFRVGNHTSLIDKQHMIKREDTSFVNESIVIGREEDQEKLVSILIDSEIQKNDASFLTIEGMGGIGKTIVARLVYNDERVKSAFPLRLWTCVSDNDQGQLDLEGIFCKILIAANGYDYKGQKLPKKEVQKRLRKILTSSKYLLVLDNVWTKISQQWNELADFIAKGHKESWILVTTRSHDDETSRVIKGGLMHKLEGLSQDKAWDLFKMMAFGAIQSNYSNELGIIGREIVEGCVGVPLAIRIAGSFLYGKDKSSWLLLHNICSSILRKKQKDIKPILELSYEKLESSLKSCFTFCAIFPKDYIIEKEVLKSLWMAQGYVFSFDDEGERIENIAEKYFSILLRRCFFQDLEYDEYGDVISCKIHNLLYDIAQRGATKEICVSNSFIDVDDLNVRHLFCTSEEFEIYQFSHTRVRTLLCLDMLIVNFNLFIKDLPSSWIRLRALKLSTINLPQSIGNLIHLRYLDLSNSKNLELLPVSIVKLYNLQTLKLRGCGTLKELPHDLNKLKNLRVLDIEGCDMLTSMPKAIDKLTNLHTLSTFVVDEASDWFNQLKELKNLENLKGKLHIKFPEYPMKVEKDARRHHHSSLSSYPVYPAHRKIWTRSGEGRTAVTHTHKEDARREGDYLKSKEHMNHIFIRFHTSHQYGGEFIRVLEEMQPHPNLKVLEVGERDALRTGALRMPSWVVQNSLGHLPNFFRLKLEGSWMDNNLTNFLPNLIRLHLVSLKMDKSYYIACLGHLPRLKHLILRTLENLEYIFESSPIAKAKAYRLLYPSLETLQLFSLKELKGWRWRSGVVGRNNNEINVDGTNVVPIRLSRLKKLEIKYCRKLMVILQCPVLESLTLNDFNEEIQVMTILPFDTTLPKLKKINIDKIAWLNVLPVPIVAFHVLTHLEIWNDKKVKLLREIEGVFRSCSSSLKYLSIRECWNIRSLVNGGLEHLNVLEDLYIRECPRWKANEDGTLWKPLFHYSLCNLTLHSLPLLVEVPSWIQFLTSLQSLKILDCKGVESLPKWMSKLSSLNMLHLWKCSKHLRKRCQKSTGEDWPLIQHIPSIRFAY